MKILAIFILASMLLFAACSSGPTQEQLEQERLEQERQAIEDAVDGFLEEQQEEREDLLTPQRGESSFDEEDIEQREEPQEVEEESVFVDEVVEERPSSSSRVDIDVLDVDVIGNRNYDINDDDREDREVTFDVILDIDGLPKGSTFLVEVTAVKRGERVDTCQFQYEEGVGISNDCIMDDFNEYGDYDLEIFADEREEIDEVDEDNNFLRLEFELED